MINQNDVSGFMDILGSLNEIEAGTNKPTTSQQSYDATKNLLQSLNDVGMAYGNLLNPEDAPPEQRYSQPQQPMNESYDYEYADWEAQEKLNRIYEQNPDGTIEYGYDQPVQNNAPQKQSFVPNRNPTTAWSLVEEIVEGTKSTKMYSIQSNHSGQKIMDGIMMYEAALTIANLLNEGRMITDTKMLGIISSGLQYTSVVNEALKAAKDRQKVLKESRYDEAKDLDIVIAEKKAEAYKLKERVLTFLKKEGYIGK